MTLFTGVQQRACCGFRWQLVVFVAFAVCVSGCRLPSVDGFAEGVAQVHRGVDRSGAEFQESAARVLGEDNETVQTFQEHWHKRREATEALVRYADALAATVDASTQVDQNVTAFGDAVNDLVGSFGAYGAAGSAAFQVGGEFYKLGATVAAHSSLESAVTEAHPAIVHIVDNILVVDLDSMRNSLGVVEQALLIELETADVEDETSRLKQLKLHRAKLFTKLTENWESNEALVGKIAQLDAVIEPIERRLHEHAKQLELASAQISAQRELLARTIEAVKEVKVSHQELSLALKNNRQLSARNLTIAAGEILQTIQEIQQIRERQS